VNDFDLIWKFIWDNIQPKPNRKKRIVNAPILKVSHPFQNTINTLCMLGTMFGLCENGILDINIFGNSDIKFNKLVYLK